MNYQSNGKLLLTGEYFVLDGAKALALPCRYGQTIEIDTLRGYGSNVIHWESYDADGKLWFEAKIRKPHLRLYSSSDETVATKLMELLTFAQQQNPYFLSSGEPHEVITRLDFPRNWGLGTSSTLVNNVAQWAILDPFPLQFHVFGGSGYDIACAKSNQPILYQKEGDRPTFQKVTFQPAFQEQLFFVYLGKKQNSRTGIARYRKLVEVRASLLDEMNQLTDAILHADSLYKFEQYAAIHEDFVAIHLQLEKVKDLYFEDYWGSVKSLGAWGGDFILVTSDRDVLTTQNYFKQKGMDTFIPFAEMVR